MKLMIIDDHAGVRELIRQLLAAPDDLVHECASGFEAVRLAPYFQPDWVTVDIRMPGPDGFATTRALRAVHPPVRVVVVSAYDEPEFRASATAAGAVAYVTKQNLADLRRVLFGGEIP